MATLFNTATKVKKNGNFPLPVSLSFRTHHSHIRRSFPLTFFMWRATVFYTTPGWGTYDSHYYYPVEGGGCGSSGLPNVYSTVLENNFGKWPNGVDITANVMCQRQKNWKTGAQPMEEDRKCQHEFISQMSCLCCVCLWAWSGRCLRVGSVCELGGVDSPCVYHLSETQLWYRLSSCLLHVLTHISMNM